MSSGEPLALNGINKMIEIRQTICNGFISLVFRFFVQNGTRNTTIKTNISSRDIHKIQMVLLQTNRKHKCIVDFIRSQLMYSIFLYNFA